MYVTTLLRCWALFVSRVDQLIVLICISLRHRVLLLHRPYRLACRLKRQCNLVNVLPLLVRHVSDRLEVSRCTFDHALTTRRRDFQVVIPVGFRELRAFLVERELERARGGV